MPATRPSHLLTLQTLQSFSDISRFLREGVADEDSRQLRDSLGALSQQIDEAVRARRSSTDTADITRRVGTLLHAAHEHQRLLTGLAQTGGPLRFGIAITGRRFTAVGAGLPQARLHLFQRRRLRLQLPRQLLHLLAHPCNQFHHRFFPFQEGAMDLVTGRQSKVHGESINISAAFGNQTSAASEAHSKF